MNELSSRTQSACQAEKPLPGPSGRTLPLRSWKFKLDYSIIGASQLLIFWFCWRPDELGTAGSPT